jgi:hypothetical protein
VALYANGQQVGEGNSLITLAMIFSADDGSELQFTRPSTAAVSGCKSPSPTPPRIHPHRHGKALEAHGRQPKWDYGPLPPAPRQSQFVTRHERS